MHKILFAAAGAALLAAGLFAASGCAERGNVPDASGGAARISETEEDLTPVFRDETTTGEDMLSEAASKAGEEFSEGVSRVGDALEEGATRVSDAVSAAADQLRGDDETTAAPED